MREEPQDKDRGTRILAIAILAIGAWMAVWALVVVVAAVLRVVFG